MTSANDCRGVAERLIAATDWRSYRKLGGDTAESVGTALLDLLRSDPETFAQIRNRVETEVAVQANLYSAAEPAIRVLAAALAEDRPRWVRLAALDLMFQVLRGAPAPEEVELGETGLADRCTAAVREGLWSIVNVAGQDPICRDAVLDVLELIDPGGPSMLVLDGHRCP